MIFVFGSNLKGIHGAGAALHAKQVFGAIEGQGNGLQGSSWAIPTCFRPGQPLSLDEIKVHVDIFLKFAKRSHLLQFQVTRIGCGFAGYRDDQIAPMFIDSSDNVWLPAVWIKTLYNRGFYDGSLEGMIKAAKQFEQQREDLDI